MATGGAHTDAAGSAEDPLSDGLTEIEGVADRQYYVTYVRGASRVYRDHRQVARINFQHRQIGQTVRTD
ncbi:hypothetical protein D3C80_1724130 [compost metagenome]